MDFSVDPLSKENADFRFAPARRSVSGSCSNSATTPKKTQAKTMKESALDQTDSLDSGEEETEHIRWDERDQRVKSTFTSRKRNSWDGRFAPKPDFKTRLDTTLASFAKLANPSTLNMSKRRLKAERSNLRMDYIYILKELGFQEKSLVSVNLDGLNAMVENLTA